VLTAVFVGVIVIGAPAQVAYIFFHNINRPRMLVLANGGHALGTMLLCLLLIPRYSALGAAAATGLTEIAFVGLLLPVAACRQLAMPVATYFGHCARVAVVMFILSYTAAWAMMTLMPVHATRDFIMLGGLWVVVLTLPAYFLILTPNMRRYILDYVVAHQGLHK
jgi:O-antigen/teichoic acid export membrane protein